ncbi:MAG: redoxin domain-containing protein [Acidobacteriota bacterium]|nr:redoxin domain-containing protein [Acidobacteriota bacterium]
MKSKQNVFGFVTLALFAVSAAYAQDDRLPAASDVPPILKIGSPAPDFNLPGIDGNMHSLKDYAASKVLAIIFTCDHCPVAQMYEKRIKQLTADYKGRGVAVVAIMPNDPKAVHLSEMGYTDLGDSVPEMKARAQYRHFNFPYLSDGATQSVALKYGPTATPHAFIFDSDRKLRYEGRIDSNPREELATKHETRAAIDSLLAGRPVAVEDMPAVGCSTKWAYKEAGAKAEIIEGEQEPVTVELASVNQLKKLRENAGTAKLLLINFWATWCAPCTAEFPELQKMVHMYRKRQLDIVTVSINAPDEKDMVLKFLNQQHAINRNLLLNSNDPADGVPAFGTGWSGAVPFTALIGMHGELLYKTQGQMNLLDVERAILKNLPDDNYKGQHAYWNSSF